MRNSNAYSAGDRWESCGNPRKSSPNNPGSFQANGRLSHDDHKFPNFGMDTLWSTIRVSVSAYIYESRVHEQTDLRPTRPLRNCRFNRVANHGHAFD